MNGRDNDSFCHTEVYQKDFRLLQTTLGAVGVCLSAASVNSLSGPFLSPKQNLEAM